MKAVVIFAVVCLSYKVSGIDRSPYHDGTHPKPLTWPKEPTPPRPLVLPKEPTTPRPSGGQHSKLRNRRSDIEENYISADGGELTSYVRHPRSADLIDVETQNFEHERVVRSASRSGGQFGSSRDASGGQFGSSRGDSGRSNSGGWVSSRRF